jgi:hypothetical protein
MVGTHFYVTKQFIHANRIGTGGWTSRQLHILGESWPPRTGWISRAAKRHITVEEKDEFIEIAISRREIVKEKSEKRAEKKENPNAIVRGKKKIPKLVVSFGKYKGLTWSRVPSDYLRFVLSEFPNSAKLQKQARVAAEVILRSRGELPPKAPKPQRQATLPLREPEDSDLDAEFRKILNSQ